MAGNPSIDISFLENEMKHYTDDYLCELKNDITSSFSFGSPISIKPIPFVKKSGVLDPLEKEIALKTIAERVSTPITVEAIRRQTGFPSLNLNEVQILDDVLSFRLDKRCFRVWKYVRRFPSDIAARKAVIYIHGGSYFASRASFYENSSKFLAEKADCVVFNIDYSLAPEHPFPCAYDECKHVLKHIYRNAKKYGIDRNKIILVGDSVGAQIAASINESELSFMVAMSVLYYPSCCLDFNSSSLFSWKESDYEIADEDRPYIIPRLVLGRSDGQGNALLMDMIVKLYVQHGEDLKRYELSPIFGDFKKIKKCLIFSAEFDGLRPQSELLAHRIRQAGGDVKCIRYKGIHHGFLDKFGYLPQAEDSLLFTGEEIDKL